MQTSKYSFFSSSSSFLWHVLWGQGLVICCTMSSLVGKWIEQALKDISPLSGAADSFIAIQTIGLYLSIFIIFFYRKRISVQKQSFFVKNGKRESLNLWPYALASLVDCGATVLIFLAVPYAKTIQISLLEDSSTPIAFLFEFFITIRQKGTLSYRQCRMEWVMKMIGVLMCLASIIFYALMQSEAFAPIQDNSWTHFILGLILPIGSATCYVISNILQVKLTSIENASSYNQDLVDKFMLRLGLLGTIWSLIFGIWLLPGEFRAIIALPWKSFLAIFLMIGGLIVFYLSVPAFLHRTSATFLNMSLMTKNFLIAILEEWLLGKFDADDKGVRWWTWITLSGILCSLLVFNGPSMLLDSQGTANAGSLELPGAVAEQAL